MSLKPAICTQCGGKIEVDDSKEAGICQFCGTAFITEKVIHQYVTQNSFAGATINIQGGIDDENLYIRVTYTVHLPFAFLGIDKIEMHSQMVCGLWEKG